MSADTLLGVTPLTKRATPKSSRVQRRLREIEQLGTREKRQVLQLMDAFLERERLKQRVSAP